jgi:adenylate cyclase
MMGWLQAIQNIGVHEDLDGFDVRRVRLLNSLCVLGIVACVVSSPWIFYQENLQGLWGNLLSQLGLVGVLWLQHRRWHRVAALAITLTGLLGVLLQVAIFPETWGIHFWLLPIASMPQVLFFREERWLPLCFGWIAFIAFSVCVMNTGVSDGQEAPEMAAQILAALMLMLIGGTVRQSSHNAEREAIAQSERADAILHMTLPSSAVAKLKDGLRPPFEVSHDECTIMLVDIVGFTKLAASVVPRDLIVILDQIFDRYDRCARRLGLEKIKTIGDAYMIAAGAPEPYPGHHDAIAELSLDLVRATQEMAVELGLPLDVRIGIHTGVAWGGVIGQTRIAFDVWGDTVNMAARMERHGLPGRIQLSAETAERLASRFIVEERGIIPVKNKGDVQTYFLNGMHPTP